MSKFDSLLKKAELFERLAIYGDRKTFLQALAQTPSLTGPVPPIPGSPGTAGGRPLTLSEQLTGVINQPAHKPEVTSSEPTPPAAKPTSSYPYINPETQKQLSRLLIRDGLLMPKSEYNGEGIKIDGSKGPETDAAIKKFVDKYKVPGTPQSIAATYMQTFNPGLETKTPF